jgi:hypothetical protein
VIREQAAAFYQAEKRAKQAKSQHAAHDPAFGKAGKPGSTKQRPPSKRPPAVLQKYRSSATARHSLGLLPALSESELMMGMKMPPARAVVEGMAGAMNTSATDKLQGGGQHMEDTTRNGTTC